MINMYIYTGFQKIYNLSIFSFSIKKVEPELVKGERPLHVSTMTALFHLRTVARTELLLRCEMLMPSPSPFWKEELIRRRKKSLFPADLFELANRGQERETIGCFNYPITGVRWQPTVQSHCPITSLQNNLRKIKKLLHQSHLSKS